MRYVTNYPSGHVYQYRQVYPCRQTCCCRQILTHTRRRTNTGALLLLAAGLLFIPWVAGGWGGWYF